MKIFSIRDSKAEAYLQPFFSPNIPTAMRALSAAAEDVNHEFNKHAADYSLFILAEFDELTGKITAHEPRSVCNLVDLATPETPKLEAIA